MNHSDKMSLFEGVLKKSASDINKPFRKRFCTVCWEEKEMAKKASLQRTISPKSPQTKPPSNSQSNCKQLVLTYYKKKEKKAEDYKGKFVLDNSDFRDVPEGIKEHKNIICIKLSPLRNGTKDERILYLSLKTGEEKECLLKVLRDHIKTKSKDDENIEDTTDSPTKFIPFDEDNPLLKELESIRYLIRNQKENDSLQNDASTDYFSFSNNDVKNNLECYESSRQSYDSGFDSTISPTCSFSSNSYAGSNIDMDSNLIIENVKISEDETTKL